LLFTPAPARKNRDHADQADGDAARPLPRLFAGRGGAGPRLAENPDAAYDYTAKGNLVAVITNGTAILGLAIWGRSPPSR